PGTARLPRARRYVEQQPVVLELNGDDPGVLDAEDASEQSGDADGGSWSRGWRRNLCGTSSPVRISSGASCPQPIAHRQPVASLASAATRRRAPTQPAREPRMLDSSGPPQ